MLTITLRDLQFRRRQFGIAVVGASLVFALTLVLTGMSAGFDRETEVTVGSIGADAWLVPAGIPGPFSSDVALRDDLAAQVRRTPGITAAAPLAEFQHRVRRPDGDEETVNVIGQPRGGLGPDTIAPPRGHAVVADRLDVDAGETIVLAGRRLRVDRVLDHATYFGGVPTVYLGLREAQEIGFGGDPLASAIVVRGDPSGRLPARLVERSNADIRRDMRIPVDNAASTIDAIRLIMWAVAALIIGAVTYLSALERVRDFAVLKAVGGSSRSLAASLTAQAVLAALLAALLAIPLGRVMQLAVTVPVVNELGAVLLLVGVAVVVGVLSSLAALRRAVGVDPALAFAG